MLNQNKNGSFTFPNPGADYFDLFFKHDYSNQIGTYVDLSHKSTNFSFLSFTSTVIKVKNNTGQNIQEFPAIIGVTVLL
jgi:hypothetical protein